jgi:hypothetical protein
VFGVALSNTPGSVTSVLARQLSVSVNQLAASNGHCYGMTFAAQRYFETPGDLPDGVDTAAQVTDPEIPLGSEEGPIGDLIDRYQTKQILDIYAWLGRRRMLRPKRIDYESELAALVAVLDEFGTAGLTLINTDSRISHQVLVYGYDDTPNGVTLAVYDPNFAARQYGNTELSLEVDLTRPKPVTGFAEYDAFVFNRWDRAIRAGAEVTEPCRSDDRDDFGHLLSRVVRVAVDTPDVSLALVDPDGTPVGRNTADYMDRERSDVSATRYRYDAPAGRYRLAVVGAEKTNYDLRVQVAGVESGTLDTAVSTSVASGGVHEYALDVPEDETPTLSRVGENPTAMLPNLDPASTAVGLAGGAALMYLLQSR